MDAGLKPPKPFLFEGNIAEKWKQWKEEFEWYLIAIEADGKTEKVRAGILLHCLGPKGREVYNTLEFDSVEDRVKYSKIIERVEAYCIPRKNLTLLRFKFFTHRQEEQLFDEFVTQLKKLSNDCEFGALRDSLVKDMIIIGNKDRRLQERLLRKPDISLGDAIKEGQAAETSRKHKETLTEKGIVHTDVIQRNKTYDYKGNKKFVQGSGVNNSGSCQYCSYQHPRGRCPAYKKACNACNGIGHFAKCCFNKDMKKKVIKEVQTESSSTNTDDEFTIKAVTSHDVEMSPAEEIDSESYETAPEDVIPENTTSSHFNIMKTKKKSKRRPSRQENGVPAEQIDSSSETSEWVFHTGFSETAPWVTNFVLLLTNKLL